MTDAWGIDPSYEDAWGRRHEVAPETTECLRGAIGEPGEPAVTTITSGERLEVGQVTVELEDGTQLEVDGRLPPDIPLGYHRLRTDGANHRLIVSPGRCHLPPTLRQWGWAVQLYATRSAQSWGMGDLGDLARLGRWAAQRGAGMLLVNPLHAVAPTEAQQDSPYYPASRRFLNPIYLRVEDVPGAGLLGARLAESSAAGRALNSSPTVDRRAVWRLKSGVLHDIWEKGAAQEDFEEWRKAAGEELEEFAVWCVLAERHGPDWRRWPARFRHPGDPAVARARGEEHGRVEFHQWLQWLCRRQLDMATSDVTVVQDLPVGVDPGGSDAWAWQDLLALDVTVGAPPDELAAGGQDWGIPPFIPHKLRQAGYEPFVRSIRATMAAGGGLRVDHVMGLFRLFWIPGGGVPADGAYVRYSADDLLDIIALESHRAGAVVVGEDLGTVEPGVRREMARRRMLSYRLLWFEDEDPGRWPELSMASITTHDLPTVAGLWTGADIAEQRRLDLSPNEGSTTAMRQRIARDAGLEPEASPEQAVLAVHRRLGRAPSRLLCATLEDAAMSERRPNIPGATGLRPNWSLALPKSIEELEVDPVAGRLAEIFTDAVSGGGEEGR